VVGGYIAELDEGMFLILQYLDDLLCIGSDASRLREFTCELVGHLEGKGLRVSPRKTVVEPVQSIKWLGKVVGSVKGLIEISVADDAWGERYLWHV